MHSRLQRPRSFWSAPRIATSGRVQQQKSAIHGLPVTLRMLWVTSDKSDWFWSQSIVFTNPFKTGMSLDLARGRDSWCWPKGTRPLGTRMPCMVHVARAWKMRTDHKSERPFCCCHKLVTWTVGLACHRCLAKCLFISRTIFTGRLTLLVLISVRWTTDTKAARNKLKSSDTTCKEGGRGKLVVHNFYFHRRMVCYC